MAHLESQVATDCELESDGAAEEEHVSFLCKTLSLTSQAYTVPLSVYTNGFPWIPFDFYPSSNLQPASMG